MSSFSLDDVLKFATFSPAEVDQIKKGQLVKGVLESLSDRELAVKFAFMLQNMDPDAVEQAFMDSSLKKTVDLNVLEVGNLIEDKTSSVDAFKDVSLGITNSSKKGSSSLDAVVKAYLNVTPGDDWNLSQAEIDAFQALRKDKKTSAQDVETTLRQVLLERYRSYRELGLKGVAPYARARGKMYHPGEELEHKTSMMSFVQKHIPEFYNYLMEYPNGSKPEGLKESFSWNNSNIDDLPTISLVHKVGYKASNGVFVFFQRFFYVSRSHNSVQGSGGCFPVNDPPGNCIMVFGTRTSTDKVAGFGGSTKKALGARIMSSKQAENFERLMEYSKHKKN